MTTTFIPVTLDNIERDAYLRGYTVLVDGEAVGTTYRCISGGWTGADVQEPSNDGTTVYTVRSLWQRRCDAAASFTASTSGTIITPADIRRGDLFVGSSLEFDWTVLANPVTYDLTGQPGGTALRVEVRYTDGDIGYRYWNSDTEARFEVVADIPGGGRRLAPIYS